MPKLSNKYHKIMSVFKRDLGGDKRLIDGDWTNDEIRFLKDCEWEFTEKIDGTNIRVHWDGSEVTFGGRSDNAQIPAHLLARLQELFLSDASRKRMEEFGTEECIEKINVTLYGEGCGKKIQKGGGNYRADGADFVMFDVKIGRWYLRRKDIEEIAESFGIKFAPVIGHGTLRDAIAMVKKGFNSQWGEFMAEGIVARPKVELFSRSGERIIVKVKHRDFSRNGTKIRHLNSAV